MADIDKFVKMKRIFTVVVLLLMVISLSAKKSLVIGLGDVCADGKVSVNRTYVDAILRAGHVPVLIPRLENGDLLKAYVKKCDIVFLTGGADVNPSYYNEAPAENLGKVVGVRDTFEMALLKEAVAQKKPLFGTCRGLQIINVFFGGSLYQDLPSQFPNKEVMNHRQGDHFGEVVHNITIDKNSRLYKVMGKTEMGVNTSHHQAVKDIAPGFRITARATDGVVEAIESDTYPAAAVQFHPEGLVKKAVPDFMKLYVNLMQLVRNK